MNSIDLKCASTPDWLTMSPDERKRTLFDKQKDLLDTFLSKGAIDRRQYEKSLFCMAGKMGVDLNEAREELIDAYLDELFFCTLSAKRSVFC